MSRQLSHRQLPVEQLKLTWSEMLIHRMAEKKRPHVLQLYERFRYKITLAKAVRASATHGQFIRRAEGTVKVLNGRYQRLGHIPQLARRKKKKNCSRRTTIQWARKAHKAPTKTHTRALAYIRPPAHGASVHTPIGPSIFTSCRGKAPGVESCGLRQDGTKRKLPVAAHSATIRLPITTPSSKKKKRNPSRHRQRARAQCPVPRNQPTVLSLSTSAR